MNINTISHPALAMPASNRPAAPRLTQAAQPFYSLMQHAQQTTHAIPSHLSAASHALSAQAAMNHRR